MNQNKKLIILGVIAVLVILTIIINLSAYSGKKALEQENLALQKEKLSLSKKAEESSKLAGRLQQQIDSFNKDMEGVSQERDALAAQIKGLEEERSKLARKVGQLEEEKRNAPPPVEVPTVPVTEDAYWAAVLKEKTDLSLQLASLRNEFKLLLKKHEQLQKDSRKLTASQEILDGLAADLVKEKNDRLKIQKELNEVKKENGTLKKQLHTIVNRKMRLDEKMSNLEKAQASLQERVTELEGMLSDKLSYIEDLKKQIETGSSAKVPQEPKKESVELPAIVVKPQGMAQSTEKIAPKEAKILTVNRENNFVIIDAGAGAGLKIGDTLRVWRSGNAIAEVTVIQVRSNITACDIKQEVMPIAVGDIVK